MFGLRRAQKFTLLSSTTYLKTAKLVWEPPHNILTQNPTVLFVPGAWHFPAGFNAVRASLESLGHPTEVIAHHSFGAEPPNKDLLDDATHMRAVIEKLVEAGKRAVLTTHSYGGVVGGNAVENLGFAQRKSAGNEGGFNFVYMNAFALPNGGDYCHTRTQEDIFYHDISPTDQQKWIAQLCLTSSAVFSGKSTHEPWRYMPCTYVFCEDDKANPLPVQQDITGAMGSDITTFSIAASHSPLLSSLDELVKGIVLAAKFGLEKSL